MARDYQPSATLHPQLHLHSSSKPKQQRAIRETAERLERAKADASDALAAEVCRVSSKLRSEHGDVLQAAIQAERGTAEARHVLTLRQAEITRKEKQKEQVGHLHN